MKHPKTENGVLNLAVNSWSEFYRIAESELREKPLIWRGQGNASWLLESTFDRLSKQLGIEHPQAALDTHRINFIKSCPHAKGLRRFNLSTHPSRVWAFARHHGLATPLLDWTKSLWIAAFFAFADRPTDDGTNCAVYGLSHGRVWELYVELTASGKSEQGVLIFDPIKGINERLLSQNGVFTWSPVGKDIEIWVREHFSRERFAPVLYRIVIPLSERHNALRSLNAMTINYKRLFPDIEGVCRHANLCLEVPDYA